MRPIDSHVYKLTLNCLTRPLATQAQMDTYTYIHALSQNSLWQCTMEINGRGVGG